MSDELAVAERNRSLWEIKALGAHARCDWDAERHALDALHLLDRIRDINKWWAAECPTCGAAIGRGCKDMADDEVHFTRAMVQS
ncbi:hypothetical protein [Mycobacterium sp. AZCC_0083]|uniref:hypothetical protein n=1 Tax=Mycobacterium sp. AZCC_0083 TaxID=2735882 RepID=UPI001615D492|nr:hypothetical protein [Mycobacterium sp. AZCC_0083]MBB5167097.1 hypothetical protein [Mycobacterium sp. AZCC_0083]